MKVLGIGNAIVDVICRVDDSFLKNHQLVKSTMKLIDENEFQKLILFHYIFILNIINYFLFNRTARHKKFNNT